MSDVYYITYISIRRVRRVGRRDHVEDDARVVRHCVGDIEHVGQYISPDCPTRVSVVHATVPR